MFQNSYHVPNTILDIIVKINYLLIVYFELLVIVLKNLNCNNNHFILEKSISICTQK